MTPIISTMRPLKLWQTCDARHTFHKRATSQLFTLHHAAEMTVMQMSYNNQKKLRRLVINPAVTHTKHKTKSITSVIFLNSLNRSCSTSLWKERKLVPYVWGCTQRWLTPLLGKAVWFLLYGICEMTQKEGAVEMQDVVSTELCIGCSL